MPRAPRVNFAEGGLARAAAGLNPQLNLRLDAQNLLRADTRRLSTYAAGSDDWRLASTERGQRTLLLSLEGKW